MKLKLTLQRSGVQPVDLVVTADATATVGEIAHHFVSAGVSTSVNAPAHQLTLAVVGKDTRALDPRSTPAESGLRPGATVTVTASGTSYRDPTVGAAAVVQVLSGPDAGREFPLDWGTSIIGRERGCEVRLADETISRQHARINVTDTVEILDLGSSNGVRVDDAVVSRMVLTDEVVSIGDTRLRVRLLIAGPTSAAAESVACIRSPRLDPVYQGVKFKGPEAPEAPRLQPYPVMTVLATLLLGAGLLIVTKSLVSIVFIALTPLLFVATTLENRLEMRSNFRRSLKQFRADIDDLVSEVAEAGRIEVAGRNREHPTAAECVDAAHRMSPLLWTRRPGEHGFVEWRLGSGRQASRNIVELPEVGKAPRYLVKELRVAVAPYAVVDGVPIVAQPAEHGSIGLAGPRATMLSAARALIVQAATLHSPAELVIAGIASGSSAPDWDWTKWLPHTMSPYSPIAGRLLASSGPAGATLVSELEELIAQRTTEAERAPSSSEASGRNVPAVLLIVEHDAPVEFSRLVGLAERGWACGIYVLWLATSVARLPAACRHFVELGLDASFGAAGFVHTAEQVVPLIADVMDAATAMSVARHLAPLVDVGARVSDDSDLPGGVSLLALAGTEIASAPEGIIERWTESRSLLTGRFAPTTPSLSEGNLRAVIGQSASGPHAVDLRADGPHALVGGTTGSGKSELLQSWILALATAHSPQRLTFLLVDYKGGSAFRDCVDLPHTVGLVTDLSPHLVRRALTSLGAELRYREHLLAKHGAKDLVTLEKQGVTDAPPSLVIVVDEFAALVTEVPEFIDGVVDVAQRGRSLGLHLILATQRPAGVIKENLRANTNLRLALRMADEDDSTDVLGSKEAAYFDPAIPGRAVSKTGPERLVRFQTGYVGGRTSDEPQPAGLTVEELVFGTGRRWETPPEDVPAIADDSAPTDIKRLVRSVRAANELAELPAPRIPWLRELAQVYDLADPKQVPSRRSDTELVFGICDDPEHQAQPTVAFHPDRDGNMIVFGTGGSGKSTMLRTLAVAAGFTVRGGPCHVYGLDFGSRGLAMLEVLPHVGSIIGGAEDERVGRLISWLREVIDERAVRYSAANAGTITDYRRLAGAPDEPRILLLVDGLAAFRQAYESAAKSRWFDLFAGIVADGRPVGVHVVLGSEQRTGLPPSIASSVQRRVVLRMASADDYGMLDSPADVLDAASPPGRGLVDGSESQVAVLGGTSDVLAQAGAIKGFAEAMLRAGAPQAPPIRSLQDSVQLTDLPAQVDGSPVIGLSGASLDPITMPVRGSFLVAGVAGSGRTTALHTIVAALRRSDPSVRLHYFGPRRSSLAGLRVWDTCATSMLEISDKAAALAAALEAGSGGAGKVAVIIENIGEFVDGLADPALTDLGRVCLAEDHLFVVDGDTSALNSSYGLLGYAKASRSGICLQPQDGDGSLLFRNDFPRITRADMPPGRGFVVRLGRPELAQIALPPAELS